MATYNLKRCKSMWKYKNFSEKKNHPANIIIIYFLLHVKHQNLQHLLAA